MIREDTRYRQKKHKRHWRDFEETEFDEKSPGRVKRLWGKERPSAKRALQYVARLWEIAGEECLPLLDGDADDYLEKRLLKSH